MHEPNLPQRPQQVQTMLNISQIDSVLKLINEKKHLGKCVGIRKNLDRTGIDYELKVEINPFVSDGKKDTYIIKSDGVEVKLSPDIKVGDFVKLVMDSHHSAQWNKVEKDAILETANSISLKKPGKRKKNFTAQELMESEKGLKKLRETLPQMKFKGRGYENDDLHALMNCYRRWAFSFCPIMHFDRILRRCEVFGHSHQVKAGILVLYDEWEQAQFKLRNKGEAAAVSVATLTEEELARALDGSDEAKMVDNDVASAQGVGLEPSTQGVDLGVEEDEAAMEAQLVLEREIEAEARIALPTPPTQPREFKAEELPKAASQSQSQVEGSMIGCSNGAGQQAVEEAAAVVHIFSSITPLLEYFIF
jgi:hypothetical protein